MKRLSEVKQGHYRIIGTEPPGPHIMKRLNTLGVFIGDKIEITKAAPGPVIFKKKDTRIGIGRGIADKILVESLDKVNAAFVAKATHEAGCKGAD